MEEDVSQREIVTFSKTERESFLWLAVRSRCALWESLVRPRLLRPCTPAEDKKGLFRRDQPNVPALGRE